MAAESLREELLSLPGVAEAEIDDTGESPSGVRVKLTPDADARRVGVEVQRILASHGLRSRVSEDEEVDEPAPSPIVALPTIPATPPKADGFDRPPSTPPPPPSSPPPSYPPPAVESASEPVPAAAPGAGLAAIRTEERRDGIAVTAVSTDGRTVTERGIATIEGLMRAVVLATGALADGRAPKVLSVERTLANGSEAIMVVVERFDGTKGAGAAMVRATRAYAVGRATWSAMRGE